MPEHNPLDILLKPSVGEINNADVVRVDINGLVAHNKLFVQFLFVSQHKDVCIGYLQLGFKLHQELPLICRIVLVELDHVAAESFLVLIGQQVEGLVLLVVSELLDT